MLPPSRRPTDKEKARLRIRPAELLEGTAAQPPQAAPKRRPNWCTPRDKRPARFQITSTAPLAPPDGETAAHPVWLDFGKFEYLTGGRRRYDPKLFDQPEDPTLCGRAPTTRKAPCSIPSGLTGASITARTGA
jgi:hypothetical protein